MPGLIRLLGKKVTVSANSSATVIELSPPKDKVYRVIEVAFSLSGSGYFEVYINEQRIVEKIEKEAIDIDSRRIVVNWELRQGDKLKIIAKDTSGSSNTAACLVVFEESSG